jgi:hypothetical protein
MHVSARPITPNSATNLWAEMTSSMPGRRAETSRSPARLRAPPLDVRNRAAGEDEAAVAEDYGVPLDDVRAALAPQAATAAA